MSKIIGIDLGTTNSAVAYATSSGPEILENIEGARTTPSIVGFTKENKRLVGVIAKRQAVTNPKNTIFGIKRFIGHNFDDTEVNKEKDIVPYEIEKGSDGGVVVSIEDKKYRSEEISAMILQKLKEDAESKLGEKVTKAIITVPAYFNDSQRKATKDAGKIAGLEVLRIINEPTAAALAYGFNSKKNEQVAVFDFGGGTFDVSILEIGEDTVEVRATSGDSHMGGKDFDQKVINWIIEEFKKEQGIDLRQDALALQRLDEAAEKAKIELSQVEETDINVPFITSGSEGPKHLMIKLTRSKLEELVREYVDRSIEITKSAINDSPFEISDIDEIILVGGQTRMPYIQQEVKKLFNKEPNKSINPDEVVALGAALQGGILQGDVKDVLLLDVTPLSLGIETLGGVSTPLIESNTTIPTSKSQVFSTASDSQTSVGIHIVQGDRTLASDNKTLGNFILDGIKASPRGVPQIEVTFDIDANGILNVTAKDKETNKEQSVKIEASSSLSEEDIERMKQDAEKHKEEDAKKKELADARNIAEQVISLTEKTMQESKDLKDDDKNKIENSIKELKETTKGEDVSKIKESTQSLQNLLQNMHSDSKKDDDGVRDADIKEEK